MLQAFFIALLAKSAAKWHCSHNLAWLECPLHREAGFRCGVQRTTNLGKLSIAYMETRNKARLKRLERLGHLGVQNGSHNSSCSTKVPKKIKNIKNTKVKMLIKAS